MKVLDNLENMLYQAVCDENFVILFIAILLSPVIAPILWIYRLFSEVLSCGK